jgi:hypothetical protein
MDVPEDWIKKGIRPNSFLSEKSIIEATAKFPGIPIWVLGTLSANRAMDESASCALWRTVFSCSSPARHLPKFMKRSEYPINYRTLAIVILEQYNRGGAFATSALKLVGGLVKSPENLIELSVLGSWPEFRQSWKKLLSRYPVMENLSNDCVARALEIIKAAKDCHPVRLLVGGFPQIGQTLAKEIRGLLDTLSATEVSCDDMAILIASEDSLPVVDSKIDSIIFLLRLLTTHFLFSFRCARS